ncbi:hypothetical protein [Halorhabdus amylolytica]|uniref:hypothetical protein n=1 Tax=Halorhabdus amylolytica TaxID=2559573 RepID=UPI0020BF3BBE|nr:hypothetical protein [Halorhabdus amylolytica]
MLTTSAPVERDPSPDEAVDSGLAVRDVSGSNDDPSTDGLSIPSTDTDAAVESEDDGGRPESPDVDSVESTGDDRPDESTDGICSIDSVVLDVLFSV